MDNTTKAESEGCAHGNSLTKEPVGKIRAEEGGPGAVKAPITEGNWRPTMMFFYGSLMDPGLLEDLLELKSPPKYHSAKISGFANKMWGPYPAITYDNSTSEIVGAAYMVEQEKQFNTLQMYESNHYTWREVDIQFDDVSTVVGRVFVWNGDHNDLEDGAFDLKKYQGDCYGAEE
jgi:gamma-glutamylcyclotransferase (GGCT)/AIG2-like uncharacterized protein YtfP